MAPSLLHLRPRSTHHHEEYLHNAIATVSRCLVCSLSFGLNTLPIGNTRGLVEYREMDEAIATQRHTGSARLQLA